MTSLNAFNSLMQQFIDELSKVFPEEKQLSMYATQFPLLCAANAKKPMEFFTSTYGPHTQKIIARDETLFQDVPMLFEAINVRDLWARATDATKDAIWKYLQNLNFLGTTLGMIPPDMMTMIENVAQSCAEKMESGQIDPSNLLSMLPQMMSALGTLPPSK